MNVVGTAADGEEAITAIARHKPDLAVLDLALPGVSGLEVLQRVKREQWPVRVLLLTACISDSQVIQAVAAGVSGIILKEAAPATLNHALKHVAAGGKWLPPEIVHMAIARGANARGAASPLDQLTPREREVAQLIADGRINREVAAALDISEGTVKIHLHSIYSKLQVTNRTAVAIMFARGGRE